MDIGHPDQAQDQAMLNEQIIPAIVQLAERLEAAEAKIGDCETMITKIITGFKGAATNQRKLLLGNSIREQYGKDLEPVMPIYKKLVGDDKDPVADIVEAVMGAREKEGLGDENEGEYIKQIVGQILDRFGLDSLRKLIDPAVDAATGEDGGGSVELEITTADATPEVDELAERKRAFKRAPKLM